MSGPGASAGAAAPSGVGAAATGSMMSNAAGASANAGMKAAGVRATSGMMSAGCFSVLAPATPSALSLHWALTMMHHHVS